jgi:bifunctional DNA-binding transcriptional regulator/antitoxin component of YhaV-PrlF toxin-antitoxin module
LATLRRALDNTNPSDSPDNRSADANEAEEVVLFLFEDDSETENLGLEWQGPIRIECWIKLTGGTSMRMPRIEFTMRLPILMVVMFLVEANPVTAQEPYFPELVFLPKNKEVNSIIDDMTSVHLKAMEEPSLWKLSQKDRTASVYRFLWLASGEHPICIRLTRTSKTFVLHVARHDGPPGLTAGRSTINKDVKINVQHGEKLVAEVQKTKFWTSPVEVKESRGIADGDVIVIEGVKDGKYHALRRAGSVTGESYKEFCRSLLELADEPNVLKAWDRFRQEERQSPGYRPEPPQTEYQGECP